MGQRDILLDIAKTLAVCDVPYLLTGSFAVAYYGYPRATHDIDFIIEVADPDRSHVPAAIKILGNAYISDSEHIHNHLAAGREFNLYHKDEGIKVDFWVVKANEFAQKYLRKHTIKLNNYRIPLISPEDLLLTKLLWCKEIMSERHFRDCVGIWKVQGNKLDKNYIEAHVSKLDLNDLIRLVSQENY